LFKKIQSYNLFGNNPKFHFLKGLKLKLFLIVPLNLASSILEILSISMLVPILGHLFGINNYSVLGLGRIQNFLDLIFLNLTLTKSLFIITALFILKNSIVISIIYFRHELHNLVVKKTSEELYKKYINLSFSNIFFLKTPYITKILTTETAFLGRFMLSFIILIGEMVVLSLIILYLFFINFRITLLIIFFMIISGLVYYFLTKNYLSNLSKNREYMENLRLKNIQEAFSGFTTVKIFQLENKFIKDFLYKNEFYDYIKKEGFIREIPRYFLEILLFIFITLIIFIYEFSGNLVFSNQSLVMISLFSIFFIRMMPNLNKIFSAFSSLIFCSRSLFAITEDLKKTSKEINNEQNIKKRKKEITEFNNNISFKNISYSFNDKKNFLNNLNFEVKKNKILGILGPSGSGKSTLINIIVGLLKPESGEIFLDNQVVNNTERDWKKLFSYVPQHIYIFDENVRKNILLDDKYDYVTDEEIMGLLKKLKLGNAIDNNLKKKLEIDGNNLSGGEKQRIGIARALITNKPILILDEATNSLDKKSQNEVLEIVKSLKKEKTIIIISHDKEVIEICDDVINLVN
jgi:ABC-type multidrug transport system fused ATPase/permease subunit